MEIPSSSEGEDEANDADEEPMDVDSDVDDDPPVTLKTWDVMKSASTTPANRGLSASQIISTYTLSLYMRVLLIW